MPVGSPHDCTALVTGATRGIGYELARLMAGRGHPLVLVARDGDALERVRVSLALETGAAAVVMPLDLALPGACERLVEHLDRNGITVSILVNNAGLGDAARFAASDWRKQAAMLQLNVHAVTHLTRLLVEGMVARRRGRILNVASTAAFRPGPWMAVYSATKAYVLSFSEALAFELAGSGVTVTALCPGPTRTGFHRAAGVHEAFVERWRMAAPADVAAFGYASMMRGQTVAIHGAVNRVSTQLLAHLPRRLVTRIVGWARRPAPPAGGRAAAASPPADATAGGAAGAAKRERRALEATATKPS